MVRSQAHAAHRPGRRAGDRREAGHADQVSATGSHAAGPRIVVLVVAPDRAFANLYLDQAAHGHPCALSGYRHDHVAFDVVASAAALAFHRAAEAVHIDIAKERHQVAGIVIATAVAIMAKPAIDPHQLPVLDGGTEEPDGGSALGWLLGHEIWIGTYSFPSQFDLDNFVPLLFTDGMDNQESMKWTTLSGSTAARRPRFNQRPTSSLPFTRETP